MKLKKFAILLLAGLAASACNQKVNIVNGQIPSQYLPQAQAVMGTYIGSFDKEPNALTASLEGNRVVLTSQSDLAGPNCNSVIGNLETVWVSEQNNKPTGPIAEAVFDFDPGLCSTMIAGTQIVLTFHKNGQLQLKLLDHVDQQPECTISGGGPNLPPVQECTTQDIPVYDTGTFTKS